MPPAPNIVIAKCWEKRRIDKKNSVKTTKITKEDIIEAENLLFSAQRVSDVELLDQLLHDDLMAVAPTGDMVVISV